MDICEDVAAVLLAGGRSDRMGRDKALLALQGVPVVRLLADRLREITDEVMISANDPSAFSFLGLPAVADRYEGRGPLAGIHAAMHRTSRPWVLALACDLPGVSTPFLRNLIAASPGFDAVIPVTSDGGFHPACALYHRRCLPAMDRNLAAGANKLMLLIEEPGLRISRFTLETRQFPDAELFDVNTPRDFAKFQKISKS